MSRFTVLHVCVGNICRSPMAERLFRLALRERVGDRVDELYISHGAGTGAWHEGEPMNPPAARELRLRGADAEGFLARQVSRAMIDVSDLILCATSEQVDYVLRLRPEADARTFVLGEFGRLLPKVDLATLPPVNVAGPPAAANQAAAGPTDSDRSTGSADSTGSVDGARDRGVALVHAVDRLRGGGAIWGSAGDRRRPSRRADDLADPWGMTDRDFANVADEIERTVVPLAAALTGGIR